MFTLIVVTLTIGLLAFFVGVISYGDYLIHTYYNELLNKAWTQEKIQLHKDCKNQEFYDFNFQRCYAAGAHP